MNKPIAATIIFGLCSSLLLSLLLYLPLSVMSISVSGRLFLFFNLMLYGFLLCRWSNTSPRALFFPLLLALMLALYTHSYLHFIPVVLCMLCWMRSGICFRPQLVSAVIAEVVTIAGSAGLLLLFWPYTVYSLPLALWMFFLVQTLYFFIIAAEAQVSPSASKDPFERASREMERLLGRI